MVESPTHAGPPAARRRATLAFLYVPLVLIGLYAFNARSRRAGRSRTSATKWFWVAYQDEGVREALWLSVQAALGATLVAMVLGRCSRSGSRGTASSGARRSRSSSSCRSRCRGSSPGLALQTTFQNVGIDVRTADDHRRPRDVLHRRRLQQRARPTAAPVGLVRGGVGRPWCRLLANLPLRDLPGAVHAAACRGRCSPSHSRSTR